MRTIYECTNCGKRFNTTEECLKHEETCISDEIKFRCGYHEFQGLKLPEVCLLCKYHGYKWKGDKPERTKCELMEKEAYELKDKNYDTVINSVCGTCRNFVWNGTCTKYGYGKICLADITL